MYNYANVATFLLHCVGDLLEAEGIVQETFFQAYYTLKRYPAEHIRTLALRAWLYKIAGIDVL